MYAYDALRKTEVVRRRRRGRLIRTTSVSQDSQLLRPRNSTFSERSKLDPVSAGGLVSVYDEIVTFTYRESAKL